MLTNDLTLYLDTTFIGSFVAVLESGDEVLASPKVLSHVYSIPRQSASLAEICQACLSYANVRLDDIGQLIVANGPGSFTGIKVGLSFAQGLVLARPQLHKVVLSSLEAMAWAHPKTLVLMPATKKQGYAALWHSDLGHKPSLYAVDIASSECKVRSEGAKTYSELTSLSFGKSELIAPWPALSELEGFGDQGQTVDINLNILRMMKAGFLYSRSDVFSKSDSEANRGAAPLMEPRYLRHSAPEEALMSKGVNE